MDVVDRSSNVRTRIGIGNEFNRFMVAMDASFGDGLDDSGMRRHIDGCPYIASHDDVDYPLLGGISYLLPNLENDLLERGRYRDRYRRI